MRGPSPRQLQQIDLRHERLAHRIADATANPAYSMASRELWNAAYSRALNAMEAEPVALSAPNPAWLFAALCLAAVCFALGFFLHRFLRGGL